MVEKDGALTLSAIRMVARFDAIVASNDEIAQRLESLGVDRSRVHRIDNVLPNPRPEGESGWSMLPVEFRRSTPRILATAAFSPEYGLDVLLEGFSGLLDSHPTAQLAILLAEKENPAYEREVKRLAARLAAMSEESLAAVESSLETLPDLETKAAAQRVLKTDAGVTPQNVEDKPPGDDLANDLKDGMMAAYKQRVGATENAG